jgi:hypothetical protein
MQPGLFDLGPYRARVVRQVAYVEYPILRLAYEEDVDERGMPREKGQPYDPHILVELAREAGAPDLAAALERCTEVWHPGGGVLSFIPLERWGDGTPLGEEVLMHHPTEGILVVQLQQDASVPEGIRVYFMERVP